jgi:mortality factor 4-like protein 1
MPPKSQPKAAEVNFYSEADSVFACDNAYTCGGKLYPAQIMRVQKIEPGVFKYLIHYKGWKRKYDIWMEPSQIALASDPAAVKSLQDRQEQANKKLVGKAAPKAKDSKESNNDIEITGGESEQVGTKRELTQEELLEEDRMIKRNKAVLGKNDLSEETEADQKGMMEVDLPMPLKRKLVNEWSLVAEKQPRRLVKLPRAHTVQVILQDYMQFKEQKEKISDEVVLKDLRDWCDSLSIYFDRALPVILLYRHERQQFDNAAKYMEQEKKMPSEVYGGEHLNRLFVRISKMLTSVVAKTGELDDFKQNCADFLKFLSKNAARYLLDEDYRPAQEVFAVEGVVAEQHQTEPATDN